MKRRDGAGHAALVERRRIGPVIRALKAGDGSAVSPRRPVLEYRDEAPAATPEAHRVRLRPRDAPPMIYPDRRPWRVLIQRQGTGAHEL